MHPSCLRCRPCGKLQPCSICEAWLPAQWQRVDDLLRAKEAAGAARDRVRSLASPAESGRRSSEERLSRSPPPPPSTPHPDALRAAKAKRAAPATVSVAPRSPGVPLRSASSRDSSPSPSYHSRPARSSRDRDRPMRGRSPVRRPRSRGRDSSPRRRSPSREAYRRRSRSPRRTTRRSPSYSPPRRGYRRDEPPRDAHEGRHPDMSAQLQAGLDALRQEMKAMFASLTETPLSNPREPTPVAARAPSFAQPSLDEVDTLSLQASEDEWEGPPPLSPAPSSHEDRGSVLPKRMPSAPDLGVEEVPKPPSGLEEDLFPPRVPSANSRRLITSRSIWTRSGNGFRRSSSRQGAGMNPPLTAGAVCQ